MIKSDYYFKCLVPCGEGWRFRKIVCLTSDDKPSNLCNDDEKPNYYEQCNAGECPKWEIKCSEMCGEKTTLLLCRNKDGLVVDDSHCINLPKPAISKCNEIPCSKWVVGDWSKVKDILC